MSSVPAAASRLAIAVVGAGGIGSTFAFYLAQAEHAVTVVARPGSPRLLQLQRDGAIVRTGGERAQVAVADYLDEDAAYDLVVVTTLAHQVDALLPVLQRSRAAAVHFMFNQFYPERLQAALGAERCSFGMPFVMGSLERDGRLNATVSASRKTLHGDRRWAELFSAAGIASAFEPDMPLWLRCHVPLCVTMESIAFKAKQRGGGATWAEARQAALGLRAGFQVVTALGYRLYPTAKQVFARLPQPAVAGMLWGLSRNRAFRELLSTGVGECRALADVLTDAGSAVPSVPPATLQALRDLKPVA